MLRWASMSILGGQFHKCYRPFFCQNNRIVHVMPKHADFLVRFLQTFIMLPDLLELNSAHPRSNVCERDPGESIH
jgi:hypothetical protein